MTTKVFEEDEADGLLAAYAIGAVDDSERARVDEYLDEHSEARADVEAYRDAAQQLHSPDGPRPDVWDGINSHITSHDPPARVAQLGDHQPRRRRRFPGAIAVAAAAAIGGLFAAITVDKNQPFAPGVTAGAQARRQVQQALRTPGAQKGSITSDDRATTAKIVVTPSGAGYVLSFTPPPDVSGVHYRLFALTPNGPVQLTELGTHALPIPFQTPAGTTSIVISTQPPIPITSPAQTSSPSPANTSTPTTSPAQTSNSSPNTAPTSPRPTAPFAPAAPTGQPPLVPIPTGLPPTTLPSLPHLSH